MRLYQGLLHLGLLALCYGLPTSDRDLSTKLDCNTMNNIGYVMSGYDVYYANPAPTGGNLVDPGFRQPIFKARYNGETTQDGRFCIPDGMDVRSCAGSCSYTSDVEIMAGKESYYMSLELKAGFSITPKSGGGFGASSDYKHVEQETSSYQNVFTHAEVSCCVYTASIYEFVHPEIHPNFIGGLKSLTEEYDEYVYRRFINAFGTHFVSTANMGAMFGQQSMISKESYSSMVSDSIDISAYASFSLFDSMDISLNSSINWNQTASEEFSKYTSEQKIYSRGAAPPQDGKPASWMGNTFEEPSTLSITITPIENLPIDEYITPTVKANLKQAMAGYCDTLVKEGQLTTCEFPEPDPPLPKPRTWTRWSNDRTGNEFQAQECPEGEYVDNMQWREQGGIYGLVDFKMRCSGGGWTQPVTGNPNGVWNSRMSCEKGFRQATGREDSWAGLVNVRAFCSNSEIEISSNSNMQGADNKELTCSKGQQMVGAQIIQEDHHGLVNFRLRCA